MCMYKYIYIYMRWYINDVIGKLSKASVVMSVAICIWQEVSSSHSDAANTALAANMLARMVLATALQLRCTVSLIHSFPHLLAHSLTPSLTHSWVESFAQIPFHRNAAEYEVSPKHELAL